MSWAQSLIKLSTYEVEVLQKRLAEIADRRMQAEMKLVLLAAEGEAEAEKGRQDAEHGWYQLGFLEGLRTRKALAQAEIDRIAIEEEGARDALALAFEEQKKYEQVAEGIRLADNKERARLETAAMDELGLRRAAAGGRCPSTGGSCWEAGWRSPPATAAPTPKPQSRSRPCAASRPFRSGSACRRSSWAIPASCRLSPPRSPR